ncbi:MAG: transporter substrate-binding protein [Bacilli bacterium]|jgi:iron complex transport system substrate-binding protein|nr:transporter substrate-binding protein [Bacilli bacterium]
MKACSFLPASTHIINELGLQSHMYGVTFECPSDKPKVVRSFLENTHHSSSEIDRIVSEYDREGKTLYYIDMDLLQSIEPDVIFTQHVCNVCQIGTAFVEKAIHTLEKQPKLVPLVPRRFGDIFENVLTIASELGHLEKGRALIAQCNGRIDAIIDTLRANRAAPRRVMIMEWLDPIYNCGHWIPEQITLAGGADALSCPAGYSVPIEWEKIKYYNPEVIVVAPCGFHIERSSEEVDKLKGLDGWEDLQAVKNGEVYLADADFFTRPSTSVVDGVELLAALFHPHLFHAPASAKGKYTVVK